MFKNAPRQNWRICYIQKFALFSVSDLKDAKLILKSKPARKLKHANSILRVV